MQSKCRTVWNEILCQKDESRWKNEGDTFQIVLLSEYTSFLSIACFYFSNLLYLSKVAFYTSEELLLEISWTKEAKTNNITFLLPTATIFRIFDFFFSSPTNLLDYFFGTDEKSCSESIGVIVFFSTQIFSYISQWNFHLSISKLYFHFQSKNVLPSKFDLNLK